MDSQPSRTTVVSVATATTLVVVGITATAIGAFCRHVTIGVDGATRGVSSFFTTADNAPHSAGVTVDGHDFVTPASSQTVTSGDTIVVHTATEHDVTVDSNRTTAWSTASSISDVLSILLTFAMSMTTDRSYTRAEIPITEAGQTIHVVVDSTTTDVVVSSDEGTTTVPERAGVSVGPISHVTLEHNGSKATLRVIRVMRDTVSSTTGIPYEIGERGDAEAEGGTERTIQRGAAGSGMTETYQETVDGDVTVSAVLSATRAESTEHIVSRGAETRRAESTSSSSSTSSDSPGISSSGSSASAPTAVSGDDTAIWVTIAQCEFGGSPSANTDNSYYGIHQLSLPAWCSMSGSGLSPDVSAEEQTMRTRMLQQHSDWGQWDCAYRLDLV